MNRREFINATLKAIGATSAVFLLSGVSEQEFMAEPVQEGEIYFNSEYFYVCVGPNRWQRVAGIV